jgi:hyperosmotically inducible protein
MYMRSNCVVNRYTPGAIEKTEVKMKLRFILFTAMVTSAVLFAACGGATNTNTNTNARSNSVTNLGANNASNGAIVVNSNTNMANSNRFSNANVSREDVEKNRADYERDRGDSTIGSGANDMWLWVKTRASLATADDLRDSTINVDVVNDVVTLRGTVASAAQKASAVKVAKAIEGVKSVTDQLKVAPADSATNMSGNSNSNTNRR